MEISAKIRLKHKEAQMSELFPLVVYFQGDYGMKLLMVDPRLTSWLPPLLRGRFDGAATSTCGEAATWRFGKELPRGGCLARLLNRVQPVRSGV